MEGLCCAPDDLRALGDACLAHCASGRPAIDDVVTRLEAMMEARGAAARESLPSIKGSTGSGAY